MFSWRLPMDRMRVLVLLLAISLTLLVHVSGTLARPGEVAPLLFGLERHLAALRVHLEGVAAQEPGPQRPEVAFNAGIADGGATSRWQAIATIMRGANRKAADLGAHFNGPDDAAAMASLDALRIELHTLEHRRARLRAASRGTEAAAARTRAEQALAALGRTLADLRRPRLN
jgi:hypothetical protein